MINTFDGSFSFLSNFYESPIYCPAANYMAPTVEHYFQAMKANNKPDMLVVLRAPTPGKAKRLGRQIKLREDWEAIKIDVMRQALKLKFANPVLKQKLKETGSNHLEEGNTWHDNFWGNCHCDRCKDIKGANHLGRLLMQLRDEME